MCEYMPRMQLKDNRTSLTHVNMVGFDDLPTEVLAQIVSYLSDDIESLRESTKVGPPLSEIASAALYKNIDLNIIEWDDDVSNEKSRKRQRRLFDSIAKYSSSYTGLSRINTCVETHESVHW